MKAKRRAARGGGEALRLPASGSPGGSPIDMIAGFADLDLEGLRRQALVIEMLGAKTGATLNALVEATGWLPHTTRAALTGLRKRGFSIERTREEGSDSIYRIVSTPAAAAA